MKGQFTVGELIEALSGYPEHHTVQVEVTADLDGVYLDRERFTVEQLRHSSDCIVVLEA